MKTIVCVRPGLLVSSEQDKPVPKAGEVLVKIKSLGICGTDIHAFGGNQPYFEYPRILGHEMSGVVEGVGEGVQIELGTAIYIIPYLSCSKCIACRNGKPNCCSNIEVLGVHRDGGMCEYVSVPESAVVETTGLSFNEMAVIECLAIGAHAVRRAKISAKDTVMVMGAGPIGLGAVQFAKVAGAKVIVSEVLAEKREFCSEEYGVFGTIDAKGDVNTQLAAMTNGEFPTVIIDCTGSVRAMESAINNLAHGGTIVYVSVVKAKVTFDDPEFHKRETTLMGSRNATLEDFEHVVSCLKNGKVNIAPFVTHTTSFAELIPAFNEWVKPNSGVIKAIVEFS